MKKIGQGWQYSVYDLENGRVYKRKNSRWEAYKVMWRSTLPFPPIWKFAKFYDSVGNEARDSLKKIEETSLDAGLFANSKILSNGIDYEQDKIIPIQDYFQSHSIEEGKVVIDKFIVFVKFLMAHNMVDKSFAIGKNFGLNSNGEVVLCDIGEIWSDPENIQKLIMEKIWSKHYVVKIFPNNHLKDYFLQEMDKHFK